jgi:hypothetical protein
MDSGREIGQETYNCDCGPQVGNGDKGARSEFESSDRLARTNQF